MQENQFNTVSMLNLFFKSINEIFVNLINLGKEVKILRKDLDYLSIKNIMNFYSNVNVKKLKKLLKEEIVSNKREYLNF